jgi:hypothetical protein
MRGTIEIYVRSFSINDNFEALIYGARHTICAPELLEQETGKFQGRALEPESAALLSDLADLRKVMKNEIRIVDIGRIRGRLMALRNGVRRTPAVIHNGKVHIGLVNSRMVVQNMHAEGDRDSG